MHHSDHPAADACAVVLIIYPCYASFCPLLYIITCRDVLILVGLHTELGLHAQLSECVFLG
jgi:hypothetical protein